jgi:hypothetical protein
MMKPRKHLWRDFNGPGKPVTEKQIEAMLARFGIKPRIGEDGRSYYHQADFEEVWKHLGIGTPKRQN